jgi:hypothetical protein
MFEVRIGMRLVRALVPLLIGDPEDSVRNGLSLPVLPVDPP